MTKEVFFEYSFNNQMALIGSEVDRFIRHNPIGETISDNGHIRLIKCLYEMIKQ